MIRTFRRAAGAAAIGLTLAFCSFAAAADLATPKTLNDAQLDKVAAGARAAADGDGQAQGRESGQSDVTLMSYVREDRGGGAAGAMGQVSASATASAGALATASSTLILSVIF